jgi:hypothetical protein
MNTKVLGIFEVRKNWIQGIDGVDYTDCCIILSNLVRFNLKHIL